jgi:hypothetical protein
MTQSDECIQCFTWFLFNALARQHTPWLPSWLFDRFSVDSVCHKQTVVHSACTCRTGFVLTWLTYNASAMYRAWSTPIRSLARWSSASDCDQQWRSMKRWTIRWNKFVSLTRLSFSAAARCSIASQSKLMLYSVNRLIVCTNACDWFDNRTGWCQSLSYRIFAQRLANTFQVRRLYVAAFQK